MFRTLGDWAEGEVEDSFDFGDLGDFGDFGDFGVLGDKAWLIPCTSFLLSPSEGLDALLCEEASPVVLTGFGSGEGERECLLVSFFLTLEEDSHSPHSITKTSGEYDSGFSKEIKKGYSNDLTFVVSHLYKK
jgi:hypothetical protein